MKPKAFTILEVLVVVSIVALLAGFLFPVLGSALKRGKVPVDTSNMSQVFGGVVLYEEDNNEEAPMSLVELGTYVPDDSVFRSPVDPVGPGANGTFPANLFVYESNQTSKYRISYAYLRSFEGRFTDPFYLQGLLGDTWDKYRFDPNIAMLACMWYVPPDPLLNTPNSNGAYVFGVGPVLRLYMDGSVRWAHPKTDGWLNPAMEILFFDP